MAQGPTTGFSKGVHDYYAHYASNADAKIGALFALNFAVGGLLLDDIPKGCVARVLVWVAVGLHVGACAVLLHGIWPRLTRGGDGIVFWEDVREQFSAEAYADEVAGLTAGEVERAYARNNYFVAKVLHRKFACVRWALGETSAAIAFALISVVAR